MKPQSPQRSAVAIRQESYRQRKEEAGYRRRTLWLHQDSEQRGYEHGFKGGALLPMPEHVDQFSYSAGWFQGAGDRQVPVFCTSCQEQLGRGTARDYYELTNMRPYELICDECVPLIEAHERGL
ncbi:hypothetical protein D9M71_388990 [compost metagenome]